MNLGWARWLIDRLQLKPIRRGTMTTINTADDFIEVLKRDDVVRSAVRREILTGELLALPVQVNAVQETQTEMLKTQTEMLKTQTEILKEIRGLKEGQRDAAEHRDILHRRYRREHDAMHRFRGNYAIDAASKNRVAIAEEFAQLEGLTDIDVEVLDEARLRVMRNRNQKALVALGISAKERNSFHTADLALEVARIGEGSRPEFYIAVEASYTGTKKDMDRAIARAKILSCCTGLDAHAVVAAAWVNPEIEDKVVGDAKDYLAAKNAGKAFWYKIVEEDMEPPSPR